LSEKFIFHIDSKSCKCNDAPPNSARDPNVGRGLKQQKKKRVGACSLVHDISRVRGHAGALGWDFDELTSKNSR
jgi:hypothetical protein